MEPKEIFAKRLKEHWEEHQLAQEQLADKIDTNKQTLSRYKKIKENRGLRQ